MGRNWLWQLWYNKWCSLWVDSCCAMICVVLNQIPRTDRFNHHTALIAVKCRLTCLTFTKMVRDSPPINGSYQVSRVYRRQLGSRDCFDSSRKTQTRPWLTSINRHQPWYKLEFFGRCFGYEQTEETATKDGLWSRTKQEFTWQRLCWFPGR